VKQYTAGTSFLKKSSKKLLLLAGGGPAEAHAAN
jgi:hypothetical protein